jgi:hypothetical protein
MGALGIWVGEARDGSLSGMGGGWLKERVSRYL